MKGYDESRVQYIIIEYLFYLIGRNNAYNLTKNKFVAVI